MMIIWRNTWEGLIKVDGLMIFSISPNVELKYQVWWVGIRLTPLSILNIDSDGMKVKTNESYYVDEKDVEMLREEPSPQISPTLRIHSNGIDLLMDAIPLVFICIYFKFKIHNFIFFILILYLYVLILNLLFRKGCSS